MLLFFVRVVCLSRAKQHGQRWCLREPNEARQVCPRTQRAIVGRTLMNLHAANLSDEKPPSSRSPFPHHLISESRQPLSHPKPYQRERITTQHYTTLHNTTQHYTTLHNAKPQKENSQKSCWGSWASRCENLPRLCRPLFQDLTKSMP